MPVPLSIPMVTNGPVSQSVSANQTVSFTAAASGNPVPTVQWQLSTDHGNTFNDIPGANSLSYSFTAVANQTGDEYRAVFTNSQGSATTTAASLTVTATPLYTTPAVTTNPVGQSVSANQTVSFTAAASGNPVPTVQWQLSTDHGNTFNDIPGANSLSYSFTAVANQTGDEYRAVFTNSQGSATTTAASLTVTATPPTVIVGPGGNAITWAAFTRTGSFQDATGTLPFTATVNYGDGSPVQPLSLNSDDTFGLNHVYSSVGNFIVTVSVADSTGLIGTGEFTVSVAEPTSGLGRVRDAFVAALYHDVIGRAPAYAGLHYWAGELKAGLRRPTITKLFFSSPERRSLVKQGVAPKISYGRALADADSAAHAAYLAEVATGKAAHHDRVVEEWRRHAARSD